MSEPQLRRLLALDLGSARIGVALSDDLGMYAHPRPALRNVPRAEVAGRVAALAAQEHVTEIVVGVPHTMSGGYSEQTTECRALAAEIRRATRLPVSEWDERLSSVQAGRTVKGADRRKSGELDSAAAAIILQAVLDSRRERAL
jgi:putative holliday junction resolvase